MNKRRLLKLADLLEQDAANKKGLKFDMGEWGCPIDGGSPSISCNTTACAMGLAALSGAFKRAGLGYRFVEGMDWQIQITLDGKGDAVKAAEKLFDIPYMTAHSLFVDNGGGPTRGARAERYVAKRLRNLVANGELD